MSGGLFRKPDLIQWSPRLTSSSTIERLRMHLERSHALHRGVFGEDASKDLVNLISSALFESDTIAANEGRPTMLYDKDDPQSSLMRATLQDWHSLDKDGEGRWQPWSLRAHQERGEARRRAQGRGAWTTQKGKMCGKVLKRNHRYYTCKTCTSDPNYLLCPDCFFASEHEGHDIQFMDSRQFANVCCCGSTAGFEDKSKAGCSHHPLDPSILNQPRTGLGEIKPGAQRYRDFQAAASRGDLPQPILHLYHLVRVLLDYVISVFSHSLPLSDYSILPIVESEFIAHHGRYTVFDHTVWAKGPWTVTVHADDRHSTNEVTRQVQHALGMSPGTAACWVQDLEQIGRKIAITTARPKVAFHTANMFQQIDMLVTLRHAYDAFMEDSAGVIITILNDLCGSRVSGDPDVLPMIISSVLSEYKPLDQQAKASLPPDLYFRESPPELDHPRRIVKMDWMFVLDGRLWKKAKFEMREIYSMMYTANPGIQDLLVDRFARNYIRLLDNFLTEEREQDTNIMMNLATIIFSSGHPLTIATGQRLLRTEEPPNQLLHDMVDCIQAHYTNDLGEERISVPLADPDRLVPFEHEVWERTFGLRNRKGLQLISQLRYILWHDEVAITVRKSSSLFIRLIQMMGCFVGLTTQHHSTQDHLKYEADYSRAFAILGEISRLARDVGECHLRFPTTQSSIPFDRIRAVIGRICADTLLETEVLDKEKYTPPVTHAVSGVLVPDAVEVCYDLSVYGIKAFSFHHPLHYLLGELSKTLFVKPLDGNQSLRMLFRSFVFDHDKLDQDEQMLLVIDQPLTTYVVLGQIRADLWKRNGNSVRNQHGNYRDLAYREAALDQEFVLLQLALCTMRPRHFITAVIDRYGFNPAFSGDGRSPSLFVDWAALVDPQSVISLLEDFVWLMIWLVSDIDNIANKSPDERCRKAIIQMLAVSPLSAADIHRRMPERGLEKSNYMGMVKEMATYRDPVENTTGIFTLKPEYYPQVDPLWRQYTRNERAAVQKILLEHFRSQHPGDSGVFVRPLPLEVPPIDSGHPLSELRELYNGEVGQRIVHYLIGHCHRVANGHLAADVVVDPAVSRCSELLEVTLYLAILILDNHPSFFAKASLDPASAGLSVADRPTAFTSSDTPNTLFENLELMQVSPETWGPFMPKIDYIINKIIDNAPSSLLTEGYLARRAARQHAKSANEKPRDPGRDTAAARQKQLMAEFAKKQADFAAFMAEEDDEDEPMEEEVEAEEENPSYGTCIVCQDPVTYKRPGGTLALFQPSRLVRHWLLEKDFYEAAMSTPCNLDNNTRQIQYGGDRHTHNVTDTYPTQHNRFGTFVSACGHLMHEECMINYFDATRTRHTHQVQRNQPENAVRSEYLCPLCKSIGNFVLPLDKTTYPLRPLRDRYVNGQPPPLRDRIRAVSAEMLRHINDSTKIWEHHEEGGQLCPWYADISFGADTLDPINRRTTMRPISRMVDRFRYLFRQLSEQSAAKYRPNRKRAAMYIPEDVVAYTVSCTEISLRGLPRTGDQKTVAEQVPNVSINLVKNLIGHLQLELDLFYGLATDRAALRVGLFTRFLPDYYRAPPLPTPVLLRDPLTLVIEAAAIAPDLVHPIMVMSYLAEVARVIICLSLFIRRSVGIWDNVRSSKITEHFSDDEAFSDDALSVFAGFRPVMAQIIQNTGPYGVGDENVLKHISDKLIAKLMYMCTLPILRRFAIVYYAISGGSYPITESESLDTSGNEYERLLTLLSMPRPTETLTNPRSTEYPIVMRWVSLWVQHGRVIANLEWPGIYELVHLPRHMDEMVLKYESKRCTRCASQPTYPALCLYCGQFLCLGGDCCSSGEQGECNVHMRDCGAANGMFLDIRRWAVLLLYAGNGSYIQIPYVDQYGDFDHRRGSRMYLSPKRLEDLRRTIWLNHGIPHTIARKLEPLNDGGGWGCL